ncbi:sensor histidine kinase, partial [Corynebacterium nasicanis]
MTALLRTLRVGLHLLFAFLLVLGLALFLAAEPGAATGTPVLPLTVALALIYVLGTVWEHSVETPPRGVVWWWLAVVTLLWHALVAVSITFVWLLFPLVLLFLHLLPRTLGVVAAALLWGIAAFVPAALHPGEWTVGSAVGPFIGTVLAVAIYWTYLALHREAAHHRAVAEDLRATQEELAASEHQAGRLEERERLSREIHDTVAQGLSSIVLLSRAVRGSLEQGDAAAALRQVGTIEEQAADSLDEARRFVRDLARP